MTFPLHPDHLEVMYECLRALPPFNRWKLPYGHEVMFRTANRTDARGEYTYGENSHEIMLSIACLGHFDNIMQVMAHEMIHLAQRIDGRYTPSNHNADFVRRAARVARLYGWDPKAFL